jgi:putative ABC transport system permease protein
MTSVDLLHTALGSLTSNWPRSLLTALGVIIGVASLIAMMAIGDAASAQINSVLSGLGTNVVTVLPGSSSSFGAQLGSGSSARITDGDLRALQTQVDGVLHASATLNATAQVTAGENNWSTQVTGATEDHLTINNWRVADGRELDATEYRGARKVALLGATTAANLFPDGGAVDATIRIDRAPFRVVGVLARKGSSVGFRDQDDVVIVPLEAARRSVTRGALVTPGAVSNISVQGDGTAMDELEAAITDLLRERHRIRDGDDDDFTVRNFAELIAARTASATIMTTLLAVVASISLVVGGIGIMNIMLVSVTERTREIGLRLALGATSTLIQRQFLLEASLLSVAGGLIGLIVAALGTALAAAISGWAMSINATDVAVAVGFSAATGIVFGWFPARRASLLDPIDALRTE